MDTRLLVICVPTPSATHSNSIASPISIVNIHHIDKVTCSFLYFSLDIFLQVSPATPQVLAVLMQQKHDFDFYLFLKVTCFGT